MLRLREMYLRTFMLRLKKNNNGRRKRKHINLKNHIQPHNYRYDLNTPNFFLEICCVFIAHDLVHKFSCQ